MTTASDDLILVTGGGTGIGFGIAESLTRAGRRVVITGRRPEILETAGARLGPLATWRVQDVDRVDEGCDFVSGLEAELGPLTGLVNNAGKHHKQATINHSVEDFAAVVHTNLTAVFALTQACAKAMLPRKRGSIVMISSMTAQMGLPEVVAYSASKTALLGLARVCAVEWSGQGVRVNVVCPGFIETDIYRKVLDQDPGRIARIVSRIPMHRPGSAGDVGSMVDFLCSDDASYVTGSVFNVDGGFAVAF